MIQELRKLAKAATPGPWIAGDDEDSDCFLVGPPAFGRVVTTPVVQIHALNDAEYIAAVNPAAILEMLDRLEKAEKDAERCKRFIDAMCEETFDTWTNGHRMQQVAMNIQHAMNLTATGN